MKEIIDLVPPDQSTGGVAVASDLSDAGATPPSCNIGPRAVSSDLGAAARSSSPGADVPPLAAPEPPMNNGSIATLSISHIFNDLNQGAVPAMLPYLITAHHLSYEAAAALVLTSNLCSSILQPLFGMLSDRPSWKINIAPPGLFLAGLGVALMGVMPNHQTLLCAAAITGVGIAAFHPDAARTANFVSGRRKATGMSFFALGGNIGFALGPLVATLFLSTLGVRGSLLLIIPAAVMAYVLYKHMRKIRHLIAAGAALAVRRAAESTAQKDRWWPFSFLTLSIVCRSIIFFGFNTFIPLYWIHHLHQDKSAGGAALTVLLTASAIGTLLGGKLADRFGQKKIVMLFMSVLAPAIALFLSQTNVEKATLCLVPLGMCLSSTFSIMVVMGQRYLPTRVGLAAGVTLGLAGSVGGLATPLLGKLADAHGVHAALETMIWCASIAFVLTAIAVLIDQFGTARPFAAARKK